MKVDFQLIKFGILLFTLIGFGSAYQFYCYSCTSCNDPFQTSKASLVLCSNGCYKNVNNIPGYATIERGCSSLTDGCTNVIYGALGYGVYNYCCWDNYCNGSIKINPNNFSYLVLFLSFILVKLLY